MAKSLYPTLPYNRQTNLSVFPQILNQPPKDFRKKFCESHGLSTYVIPILYDGNINQSPSKIHVLKGDGNCFFRSISFLLTGSENQHLSIRKMVVEHMNNSSQFSERLNGYLNSKCHEYIRSNKMNENGTWATDAEILSTANLLELDISVWSYSGEQLGWLRYPFSFTLETYTQFTLLLVNEHNLHFDAVIAVI